MGKETLRTSFSCALVQAWRTSAISGQGNLADFVLALSNRYGLPVVLDVKNPMQSIDWKLDAKDPAADASRTVSPLALTVDRREGPMVVISDR